MSHKNRDERNRWRNKTVAFRVSPEEDKQLETYVKLSGLTKQDYITRRLLGPGKSPGIQGIAGTAGSCFGGTPADRSRSRNGPGTAGINPDDRCHSGRNEGGNCLWKLTQKKRLPLTHLLAQMKGSRFKKITTIVYPILTPKSMIQPQKQKKVCVINAGKCKACSIRTVFIPFL